MKRKSHSSEFLALRLFWLSAMGIFDILLRSSLFLFWAPLLLSILVALLFAFWPLFRPLFANVLQSSPRRVCNYVRILMHTGVTTGVKILPRFCTAAGGVRTWTL